MPEVVRVATVESSQTLLAAIEEYFKRGRYAEITQAIGMHSILIERNHTIEDQNQLYRKVLAMIKNRVAESLGRQYSAWYADFPKTLDAIVASRQVVTDKLAAEALSSHRAAYGPFRSVEDFYLWALDDRRLTLDQIVKYIDRSVEACRQ